MKKGGNFIVFIGVLASVLILGACEKPDGQPEFINTNDTESLLETTIENKYLSEEIKSETTKSVFVNKQVENHSIKE